MVQNRVQHPPPHPPRTTQPPKLWTWPDRLPSNVNQVLQDQRRLECMQAHNTACNSYYSGLKPHRTSALSLATATAARVFLGAELLQAQTPTRLNQVIVLPDSNSNSQGLDALATQRQSATAVLSFLKIEWSNPPLSVPPTSKKRSTFCGVHLAGIVSTI